MLVDAMERHGHLDLDPVIKAKLFPVSAASIDCMLDNERLHIGGQRKRRKGVSSAIPRSIPVRTFADWRDPQRASLRSTWSNTVAARRPTVLLSTPSS